ncbi:MAG TPA: helix-turn-helix domain-containing protein [Planctomycetota bacterium]|nr:helix-turn-helix domain-containing protein [Planctomycetota bacterium]
MQDFYAVPEQAIQAFEQATRLSVVVHDLGQSLSPFLRPDRYMHTQPLCAAMKRSQHGQKCYDFELTRLHPDMGRLPDGRVQLCHAGLVQWVVPVFWQKQLEWVLFAGQRTLDRHPPSGAPQVTLERDPTPPPRPSPWAANVVLPPPVDEIESQRLLELLRQLAARLRQWLAQSQDARTSADRRRRPGANQPTTSRAVLLRRFIAANHAQPVTLDDLAAALHLSTSRAAHVVRELAGQTFVDLLTEARLRTAASLLRHSDLKIPEIADRSGFGDLSYFHRCFKKAMHTTPHRYRTSAETVPGAPFSV